MVWVRLAEETPIAREPDAHQHEKRRDPVAPGQLLALCARASGVIDGHLIYPIAQPQNAPRDLGFDIEAIAAEIGLVADDLILYFDKAFPTTTTDKISQALQTSREGAYKHTLP